MLNLAFVAVIGIFIYQIVSRSFAWRRHLAEVKSTGIPYINAPVSGDGGFLWIAIHDTFFPTLYRVCPFLTKISWMRVIDPHHSWSMLRDNYEKHGDTHFRASPGKNYLVTTDADLIKDITTRKVDFEKPIEQYEVIDIYGKNMLTLEADEWKRHRKIAAPAFGEKSNALVWDESVRQTNGMIDTWTSKAGKPNDRSGVLVPDTAVEAMELALHVISGAGFGVSQLWSGQSISLLGDNVLPGFNTAKTSGQHTLTFLNAMRTVAHSFILFALLPISIMKYLPFKVFQDAIVAYNDLGVYYRELAEYKLKRMEAGETDVGTMDLMGTLLKSSDYTTSTKQDSLSKEEVTANCWIFLFAGHETTANTLNFSLIYLAIDLISQAQTQADIDEIANKRSAKDWTYTSDMRRFYNSMVGAVQNEALRLIPPVMQIPKMLRDKPQTIKLDNREHILPPHTFIHLDVINTHRNPKYYPHQPSKLSNRSDDLYDFVPQRWLPKHGESSTHENRSSNSVADESSGFIGSSVSFETSDSQSLYTPPTGAFIAFSLGARGCPGRRFAQVEITAVLATIFASYSVELDVSTWATDDEVEKMDKEERKKVYEKAMERARDILDKCEMVVTLKNVKPVPLRLVKRGRERFMGCYDTS